MKIRTGRKNPHTLYFQLGAEPSDDDLRIGFMIDPMEAAILAEASFSLDPFAMEQLRHMAAERIASGR